MSSQLTLLSVPYSHPHAVALTALAQQFYVDVYGGPDETPVSDEEFASPHGDFLVGSLDGHPVAMGGWRFTTASVPKANRPAELKRMFVSDRHRGRGLARQVLAAVEASAAAAGADWVVLETGAPQVAAISLYRSAGYRTIPPFGHYADSPSAVHLGRSLTDLLSTHDS